MSALDFSVSLAPRPFSSDHCHTRSGNGRCCSRNSQCNDVCCSVSLGLYRLTGAVRITGAVPHHRSCTVSPGLYRITGAVLSHRGCTASPGLYRLTRAIPSHRGCTTSPGLYHLTGAIPSHRGCTDWQCNYMYLFFYSFCVDDCIYLTKQTRKSVALHTD